MPDINLPRRIPALATRRRSVDAPTAADVPTVNPAVARDSGLNVPAGAFGGGIIESQLALEGLQFRIAQSRRAPLIRQIRITEIPAGADFPTVSATEWNFGSHTPDINPNSVAETDALKD